MSAAQHSQADEKAQARMRKLLALADRGEGGEKANAQRMLDSMLRRHGMAVHDLIGEKRELHWFKVRSATEKQLARQIAAKVLDGQVASYRNQRNAKQIGIETTPAEAIEIELHIETLRPALEQHMELAFSAFVQANRLFQTSPSEEPARAWTDEERARVRKVLAMADATDATPVHKRIPNASAKGSAA
ncbi:hypothetical protein [Variovorax sp. tm]|uniref:hypothetical protein n=1 Tax=Variovorax atrisoli TaxID=3394203 RepID=UPI003A802DC8